MKIISIILLIIIPSISFSKLREIDILFKQSHSSVQINSDYLSKNKLQIKTIQTVSPYEDGSNKFEGYLLKDLILKVRGKKSFSEVRVIGSDSYQQILTNQVINEFEPLLAFKMNEKVLTPKNRGSFRLVFDYSKHERIFYKKIDPLWVWSISEIEIID